MKKTFIDEFIRKSFNEPDEKAQLPGATIESVKMGEYTIHRMKCDPGWRWTETLPKIIGTDTCEFEHPIWMMLSGHFVVQMNDGRTHEFGPGDIGKIPPGHDAWVKGDEPVLAIDIQVNGHA
ncbi:MAG: cupin [Bacteroidetes bacterium]|nr:MAG: cupin [Bacteroidota bacterium]